MEFLEEPFGSFSILLHELDSDLQTSLRPLSPRGWEGILSHSGFRELLL